MQMVKGVTASLAAGTWFRPICKERKIPVHPQTLMECLEDNPVIAAICDDKWTEALAAPVQVLFYLSANLLTVKERIRQAHEAGKLVMVHIDLAEGIGKDSAGVQYLADCGADGIISTRANMIRLAKSHGLVAIQRVFALDSKGMDSIEEMIKNANPHLVEIMPGVVEKAIRRFSQGRTPVIAGGLIETKQEVTGILRCGALAVSTGKKELWHV
ncbi:MAG: glycerol-3-phosphate responsive antiterminator [Oscillospiraceae bacterium]|nr:glycerol-3-phosphate responsive antiterminator [Oscillospiraceae bacterium]